MQFENGVFSKGDLVRGECVKKELNEKYTYWAGKYSQDQTMVQGVYIEIK